MVPELKGVLLYLPDLVQGGAEKLKPLLETASSLGTRRILCASAEGHPLLSEVDQASSNEMVVKQPPDPEALFSGATLAELPIRDCLLITDSPEGTEAGRRANLPTLTLDLTEGAELPSAVRMQELFGKHYAPADDT